MQPPDQWMMEPQRRHHAASVRSAKAHTHQVGILPIFMRRANYDLLHQREWVMPQAKANPLMGALG